MQCLDLSKGVNLHRYSSREFTDPLDEPDEYSL